MPSFRLLSSAAIGTVFGSMIAATPAFAQSAREPDAPSAAPAVAANASSGDEVNYRGSAKYELSGHTNVYASVASGTKAGGFNGRATIASELSYRPEKNTTYGVGLKTSTPDNGSGWISRSITSIRPACRSTASPTIPRVPDGVWLEFVRLGR